MISPQQLLFLFFQQALNKEKKKYAAERDFNHLKNNIAQLSKNVEYQTGENDKNFEDIKRDILEIKIKLGLDKYSKD